MKRNRLTEIIASLFILLFVYTASSKLLGFNSFRHVLSMSPLIGKQYAGLVAWTLPFAELLISALLFFPATRQKGLWASFAIMIVFTTYLTYMIYFNPNIPCSCGGVLRQMTWKQHLVFNIFFTLLAAAGLLWGKRKIPQSASHVTYSATA